MRFFKNVLSLLTTEHCHLFIIVTTQFSFEEIAFWETWFTCVDIYVYIYTHYSHWSAQASFTLVCRDNSHLKQCFDSSQIIYCFNQRSHPYQGDVAQKNTMDPSRTTILFQKSAACIQNRICSSNVSVFYMTKKCAARSSNSRKWEELPTSKVWFWKDILFWSNITLCIQKMMCQFEGHILYAYIHNELFIE